MPSGSKKRKSVKKKKKLEANNNNNNINNNNNVPQVSSSAIVVNSHSHGKEDLKHGGEKEIDGGDVSYSASQDHQFNDREGIREKQLEIPHSESSIDNIKSNALEKGSNEVNKVAMVEGGIVQVKRELKLEGESMRNNIDIERVEPVRFPHEGGLRRRSSSSSKPAMSEDIVQVATSASDIDNETFGSSEKENEKRELGVIDEKTRTSDVVVDTGLEKRDYQAVATSNAKPSKAVKDGDKLEMPYDVPAVDAGVCANNMVGSPHEHQPLVALDPRPVQTTSWKSCCGLFEVFAGSNK